jgi:uncharacterized protein YaaQ
MKLIMAIIKDTDAEEVIEKLVANQYRVTRMASTGGFLRRGNVTLMVGAEDDQVEAVENLIRESCCSPDETGGHRATLFVLNASHFEQI